MIFKFLHESLLWLALLAIVGTCLFLNPVGGLFVAVACGVWIFMVYRRT